MQVRGTGMRFTVLGCSQLPGESTQGESRAEEAGALGDHLCHSFLEKGQAG